MRGGEREVVQRKYRRNSPCLADANGVGESLVKNCGLGREKGRAGRPVVQAVIAMCHTNGDKVGEHALFNMG